LTIALVKLGIELRSGDGAPTAALEEAVRRRAVAADREGQARFIDASFFSDPVSELSSWLESRADRDLLALQQIEDARRERDSELTYSQGQIDWLKSGIESMQQMILERIESSIASISSALDRLNRSAGGDGADLRPNIAVPASTKDRWTCDVVPRWRRAKNGPLLPYNNVTNSAQEKLFSIHLVLAALLASPYPRGRVLILDELGDSLGAEHRRDVLSAIASTASEFGITVLGTCQDAVLPDAHEYCREILHFHYPSKSEALNRPTRMFGFDSKRDRVELTAGPLTATRVDPQSTEFQFEDQ
jgi:hypothetical protein